MIQFGSCCNEEGELPPPPPPPATAPPATAPPVSLVAILLLLNPKSRGAPTRVFFVRTVVPEDDAPAPAVDVVADEEDGPLVWLMVEGEREMKKGGNKEWEW